MHKRHEYLEALEEERRKIEILQRDLPLSHHLVTQAIEIHKQQLIGPTTDCNEQEEDDDGDLESHNNNDKLRKSDWLRSVQLWNQSSDPSTTATKELKQNDEPCRKVLVVEVKRSGGAFQPYKKEKSANCVKDESGKEGGRRKARRCWSPELHRRFINALQQLGGPHVATPKQIRELMKMDGLTNDEVKSHLQKYRLHSRRPTPSLYNNANTVQAPQFVVVGSTWVPQPYYVALISP